MNSRDLAEKLFREGVDAVRPGILVRKYLEFNGKQLRIGDDKIEIDKIGKIFVIGAGKASASMAYEVEKILGARIDGGHIVVKYGFSVPLNFIEVTEAGHPVPDNNGFLATDKILRIADSAQSRDIVICLISGGGSALLADCPRGIAPDDISDLNNRLVKCGANINEINIVRKHISDVKGGRLAARVYHARLYSLILSDVPGDSPESIASGPTCPDSSTFSDAMAVVEKYKIKEMIPSGVLSYLIDGVSGAIPESPKKGEEIFTRVSNYLIGTNKTALDAASDECRKIGMNPIVFENSLSGPVEKAGDFLLNKCREIKADNSVRKPAVLIAGGETTVKPIGNGTGGRNQHLALSVAIRLKGIDGITFLAAGTDGNDGPTDAAGAVVDCSTIMKATELGIIPEDYLTGYDSYNFFRLAGGHIITGPTMTNVMDIVVAVID